MDQRKSTMRNKKLRLDIPSILSLPNEVIINILEHVTSIYDKISFSRTCIRFHNLFNSISKLHNYKLVVVTNQGYDTFFKLFLKQQNKNIRHIVITHIHFEDCKEINCLDTFWNEYGEKILSLHIFNCGNPRDDDVLRRIVSYCPNLEELRLYVKDHWTKALNKCSELKYVKLESLESDALSDYSLNNFIKNAPNLTHLGFDECYNKHLLAICNKKNNEDEEDVNTEYLTIKNFKRVVIDMDIFHSILPRKPFLSRRGLYIKC